MKYGTDLAHIHTKTRKSECDFVMPHICTYYAVYIFLHIEMFYLIPKEKTRVLLNVETAGYEHCTVTKTQYG